MTERKETKNEEQLAYLPYGHQSIDGDDIEAVVEVLRSDWLTTGPKVQEFEKVVCDFTGAKHGVAVSSGTAALHAAMAAIAVCPGDEVIVPPMTFAATANSILYQGAKPVFADVDDETLLLDPVQVEQRINENTKAIIAVDYAGQPCDYNSLRRIAKKHGLVLIADACHSLGAKCGGRKVGTLADLTVFSFHPVKHITTGEGGMVVTDNDEYAERMRCFRNHGITTDHRQRASQGMWFYEMTSLGYNFRISDIQCALGISQLGKLPRWIERRRKIAASYDEALATIDGVDVLDKRPDVSHAYHLYVIRVGGKRADIFSSMRDAGIGVNVHYIPVYMHPYYRDRLGYSAGLCPVAESLYEQILSLPMFPALSDSDVDRVVAALSGSLTGRP